MILPCSDNRVSLPGGTLGAPALGGVANSDASVGKGGR